MSQFLSLPSSNSSLSTFLPMHSFFSLAFPIRTPIMNETQKEKGVEERARQVQALVNDVHQIARMMVVLSNSVEPYLLPSV